MIPWKNFFNKYFIFEMLCGRKENVCIKTDKPEKASVKEISGRWKTPRASLLSAMMLHPEPTSRKDEISETIISFFTKDLTTPIIPEKKIM